MKHTRIRPRVGLRSALFGVVAALTCAGGLATAGPLSGECMSVGGDLLETPVWMMSTPRFATVPVYGPHQDVRDDTFFDAPFFGMSCDGPHSCSPQLVAAVERLERLQQPHPMPSGPMCLPGEPGCNIAPGGHAPPLGVDLHAPLVPFLTVPVTEPRTPGALEPTVRVAGQQHLYGRLVQARLDRPPRG